MLQDTSSVVNPRKAATVQTLALSQNHRAELHDSGLADDTIERAGIYSVSAAQIAKLLGWKPRDFDFGAGWVAPLNGDGSTCFQIKLDFPRSHDDKIAKYETPRGAPNRAFFMLGFAEAVGVRIGEYQRRRR